MSARTIVYRQHSQSNFDTKNTYCRYSLTTWTRLRSETILCLAVFRERWTFDSDFYYPFLRSLLFPLLPPIDRRCDKHLINDDMKILKSFGSLTINPLAGIYTLSESAIGFVLITVWISDIKFDYGNLETFYQFLERKFIQIRTSFTRIRTITYR